MEAAWNISGNNRRGSKGKNENGNKPREYILKVAAGGG
jgi:hypothetical protein